MMLREKMIPCQSREAIVTVLSYHNGIMDGWLLQSKVGEKREDTEPVPTGSAPEQPDRSGGMPEPCPATGASRRCEEGRDIPNSDLVSGTLYMAGKACLAQ